MVLNNKENLKKNAETNPTRNPILILTVAF